MNALRSSPLRMTSRSWSFGFTILEALAAMMILALAVPSTVVMISDAARSRIDSTQVTRATWLAHAVLEQIRADIASPSPSLGMDALADSAVYLDTPVTGLRARLNTVSSVYVTHGLAYDVAIGALVDDAGAVTGDADEDIYRLITVTVTWTSSKGAAKSLGIGAMVTDLGD